MEPRYLRVDNWGRYQHYDPTKRTPPWIKLYQDLLADSAFMELDEDEQWQLVRVWMITSRSQRFTRDEKGRLVQVIADDEKTIRRAIQTISKVPVAKFIREGWLIPVEESELVDPDASEPPVDNPVETPPDASAGASTTLAPVLAPLSSRGLEEELPRALPGLRDAARARNQPDSPRETTDLETLEATLLEAM